MSALSDRTRSASARFGLLALAIVLASGVWFWRTVVRAHGFFVSMQPIDATHAVVCIRANGEYGYAPRAWIALLDASGDLVWTQKLPGLPPVGAHEALLVEDGIAVVRTMDASTTNGHTSAFRVNDGAPLWSTPFAHGDPHVWVDLVGNGPSVAQGAARGKGLELVSIAKADGKVEWEQTFESTYLGVQRMAGRLVVDDPETSLRLQPTSVFTVLHTRGCVDDGELVALAPPDATHPAPRVVARRFDSGAVRTITESFAIPDESLLGTTFACGTRAGRYVFLARLTSLEASKRASSRLVLVDVATNGSDPRVTPLPDETRIAANVGHVPEIAMRYPEADPMRGALPRFVPFVFTDEKIESYVTVLDLEERRFVRRGPPIEGPHVMVFRDGERTLLAGREMGALTLARFDGATGKVVAATTLAPATDWKPFHARDGRLWIYDISWRSPLPFVVLDAASLAKVGGTVNPTDALAAAKQWLPD